MNKAGKWIVILVGTAAILGTVIWSNWRVGSQTEGMATAASVPQAGYKMAAFSLPAYPDQHQISTTDFNGKPIYINFWASWCPPCQAESPDLEKAFLKYGDKIQFLAVNVTDNDKLADVQSFLEKYGITYPVLLDEKGNVSELYQVDGIPASFFIDRSGMIVDTFVGAIPPQVLDQDLQKILK